MSVFTDTPRKPIRKTVSFEMWEPFGDGRRFIRRKTVSEVLADLNYALRDFHHLRSAIVGCRLSQIDTLGTTEFPRCRRIACYAITHFCSVNVYIDAITETGELAQLYSARITNDVEKAWELARTCSELLNFSN